MNVLEPQVVMWAIGGGIAGVALAMVLHLIGRGLFHSQDARQRGFDVYVVGELQTGVLGEEFIRRLKRVPQDMARRSLVHALQVLGPSWLSYIRSIYDHLGFGAAALRAMQSRNVSRRAQAAIELGVMQHAEAAQECMRLLSERYPEVRLAAVRALGMLKVPGVLRIVLESIPVCSRWAVGDAVELIRSWGESAAAELMDIAARTTYRAARVAAIEGLGEIRCQEAVPVFERMLSHSDLEARVAAARALGEVTGADAVRCLGLALRDPAWEVRAAAARALAAHNDPQVPVLLKTVLGDASWWVRQNAGEALGTQESAGAEALRQTLSGSDSFARDIATQMLEKLGLGGAS